MSLNDAYPPHSRTDGAHVPLHHAEPLIGPIEHAQNFLRTQQWVSLGSSAQKRVDLGAMRLTGGECDGVPGGHVGHVARIPGLRLVGGVFRSEINDLATTRPYVGGGL